MSAERMHLHGSFGDPEPVELMDDDESGNSSDNDDMKSVTSEPQKPDSPITFNMDIHSDTNNNHTGISLHTNGVHKVHEEFSDGNLVESAKQPVEELCEEDEERKRFQIELEFVQSLANPNYLNFLAQRGYFRNQTFLNYLKYLQYWTEPEYVKYIMYPQCLSLLELLQHEQFLKEILNAQCSKYIDEQLLLIWLHYKKRRDWIRIDPAKVPDAIEKLFQSTEDTIIKNTEKFLESSKSPKLEEGGNQDQQPPGIIDVNVFDDAFSVQQFLENEKF